MVMILNLTKVLYEPGAISGQVSQEANLGPSRCDGIQRWATGQLWEGEKGSRRAHLWADQTDGESQGRDRKIQIWNQAFEGQAWSCTKWQVFNPFKYISM